MIPNTGMVLTLQYPILPFVGSSHFPWERWRCLPQGSGGSVTRHQVGSLGVVPKTLTVSSHLFLQLLDLEH